MECFTAAVSRTTGEEIRAVGEAAVAAPCARLALRTENWGRNSPSLRDGEVKGSPCDPLDTGRRIADISDEEAEAAAVAAIRPRSRRRRTARCR
jgi:hypothetical protein